MIYLFSKFHCLVSGEKNEEILPYVFYELKNVKNEPMLIYGFNGEVPTAINFFDVLNGKEVKYVTKIEIKKHTFLFLNCPIQNNAHFAQFKLNGKDFCVSVSSKVVLTINGDKILENELRHNITYSHFEQIGEFCLIYFTGKRNFVIITQNTELKFADFYDEINIEKEARYFMKKLYDSLNHGRVAKIVDKKFESYLVYLDENELGMKNEFAFLVFLDCFIAGNFKYCNQLLCDEIKQKDEKNIKKFFAEFDEFVPFENMVFTFKKNTLAGVYQFECLNNKIENIIHLEQQN